MKNFVYCLIFFILTGCAGKNDDPSISYGPEIIAKHQTPFGSQKVEVKVHKVISDNQLIGEFLYEDGFLSEHKEYLKFFEGESHYATAYFKRKNNLPFTYEKFTAEFDPEFNWISDKMESRVIYKFKSPESDSSWSVSEEQPDGQYIERKYFFDKQGYISNENVLDKTALIDYKIIYSRNEAKNILSSRYQEGAKPIKIDNVTSIQYEYDAHPNPFFLMGLDWKGDRSIHTFSPNNIIKETIYYGDKGESAVNKYDYEYLPNGFPSRLTIRMAGDNPDLEPYSLNFTYY